MKLEIVILIDGFFILTSMLEKSKRNLKYIFCKRKDFVRAVYERESEVGMDNLEWGTC